MRGLVPTEPDVVIVLFGWNNRDKRSICVWHCVSRFVSSIPQCAKKISLRAEQKRNSRFYFSPANVSCFVKCYHFSFLVD
jgi:hypothetical protein